MRRNAKQKNTCACGQPKEGPRAKRMLIDQHKHKHRHCTGIYRSQTTGSR